MPLFPISLIKRLILGVKLTPAQEDGNMTTIENAANDLNTQLSVSLNPNGTLKAGSVNASNIFGPRVVDQNALSFLSNFWAQDTGAANAMVVAYTGGGGQALAAYAAGIVLYVRAAAPCSGATTCKVDALAVRNVKKYTSTGIADLVTGDIITNGEYVLVDDGTQFILINPTPPALAPGSVVQHTATDVAHTLNDYNNSWTFPVFPVSHLAGAARPLFVQWSLLCINPVNVNGGGTQYNSVSGDEISVDNLIGFVAPGAPSTFQTPCQPGEDDNFLWISFFDFNGGPGNSINVNLKDGSSENSLIPTAWRLRVRWGVLA